MKNLVGKKFNRLTPVSYMGNSFWLCRCDCGEQKAVKSYAIQSGNTKSCGCYGKELVAKRTRTHGEGQTRLFRLWCGVKSRCKKHPNYGDRGIRIANEWLDYTVFRDWALENGYRDDLSIERINVDGNYEPSNCCWIPRNEQGKNRRDTVWLTIDGLKGNLDFWESKGGVKKSVIWSRIKKFGWEPKAAVFTRVKIGQKILHAK